MTKQQAQEARARCGAATPGLWFEVRTTKAGKTFTYSKYPFEMPDDLRNPDQNLINHAPTDIKAALDMLERAAKIIEHGSSLSGYQGCAGCEAASAFLREWEGVQDTAVSERPGEEKGS